MRRARRDQGSCRPSVRGSGGTPPRADVWAEGCGSSGALHQIIPPALGRSPALRQRASLRSAGALMRMPGRGSPQRMISGTSTAAIGPPWQTWCPKPAGTMPCMGRTARDRRQDMRTADLHMARCSIGTRIAGCVREVGLHQNTPITAELAAAPHTNGRAASARFRLPCLHCARMQRPGDSRAATSAQASSHSYAPPAVKDAPQNHHPGRARGQPACHHRHSCPSALRPRRKPVGSSVWRGAAVETSRAKRSPAAYQHAAMTHSVQMRQHPPSLRPCGKARAGRPPTDTKPA